MNTTTPVTARESWEPEIREHLRQFEAFGYVVEDIYDVNALIDAVVEFEQEQWSRTGSFLPLDEIEPSDWESLTDEFVTLPWVICEHGCTELLGGAFDPCADHVDAYREMYGPGSVDDR